MGRRATAINAAKATVKAVTPPIIWRGFVKAYLATQPPPPPPPPPVGFFGNYATWDEGLAALEQSNGGYEAGDYLEYTRKETVRIRDEKTVIHPWWMPMMLSMEAAILDLDKKSIKVLDFGGALGAHYFEVRRVVPKSIALDWTVVELPEAVEMGTAKFASAELKFATDMALVEKPDIVLASCVFLALPKPYAFLRQLLAIRAPHTILPLIPLRDAERDRLTIQYVGSHIANIRILHWFFSRSHFTAIMREDRHRVFSSWRHPEYTNQPDGEPPCEYFGFHLLPPNP